MVRGADSPPKRALPATSHQPVGVHLNFHLRPVNFSAVGLRPKHLDKKRFSVGFWPIQGIDRGRWPAGVDRGVRSNSEQTQ